MDMEWVDAGNAVSCLVHSVQIGSLIRLAAATIAPVAAVAMPPPLRRLRLFGRRDATRRWSVRIAVESAAVATAAACSESRLDFKRWPRERNISKYLGTMKRRD